MATTTSGYGFAARPSPDSASSRPSNSNTASRLPLKPALRNGSTSIPRSTPRPPAATTTSYTSDSTPSVAGSRESSSTGRRAMTNAFPTPPTSTNTDTLQRHMRLGLVSKDTDGRLYGTTIPSPPMASNPHAAVLPTGYQPLVHPTVLEDIPGSNTPSLVSGSSLSSQDSPVARGKTLRRKRSVIGQYKADMQPINKIAIPRSQPVQVGEATLEASAPILSRGELDNRREAYGKGVDEEGTLPRLQATFTQSPSRNAEDDSTHYRPTPVSEASSTPSLTYSASPSTFSHTTTATTRTAYSPFISASPSIGPRWYNSPQKASHHGIVRPKTTESTDQHAHSGSAISHPFFSQSESLSMSQLPKTSSSMQQGPARVVDTTPVSPTRHTSSSKVAPAQPQPKATPVHPPELAHLNTTPTKPSDASPVPTRPTRDGIQSISDQQHKSHIVHSNLPTFSSLRHRRRSSRDDTSPTKAGKGADKSVLQHQVQLKAAQSPQLSGPSPKTKSTPALPRLAIGSSSANAQPTTRSKIPPPSPTKSSVSEEVVSKRKTRFGFFSKKSKPEVAAEEVAKSVRKGPVAGTGHEGYGNHAVPRGRSNSNSSTTTNNVRSGSAGSSKPWTTGRTRSGTGSSSQGSDLDEFLQQRLTPVYMKGGGSSAGSRQGSVIDDDGPFSPPQITPDTPQTSTSVFSQPKRSVDIEARPSTSSKPGSEDAKSRGRTSNESKQSRGESSTRSPSRRRLQKAHPKPSALPQRQEPAPNTLLPADYALGRPSTSASRPPTAGFHDDTAAKAKKSGWSMFNKPVAVEKQERREKQEKQEKHGHMWNPFQRSKSQPSEPAAKREPSPEAPVELPPPADPLQAHYISPDEEVRFDAGDLDQIMREAAVEADDSSSVYTDFEDVGEQMPEPTRSAPVASVAREAAPDSTATKLTPTVPALLPTDTVRNDRQSADKGTLAQPIAEVVAKTSRLPQVGRIPKVISTKDRPRKLPNHSFSRPFADSKPNMQEPSSARSATFPPSVRSVSPMKSDRYSQKASSQASSGSLRVPSSIGLKSRPSDASVARQFIDFGPRKNSDLSFSSASGTLHFPTASTIAYGPGRNSGASLEESWPEFDDLIDHVMTPSETSSNSPRNSSQKAGFQGPSGIIPGLGGFNLFPRPTPSRSVSPKKYVGANVKDGLKTKRSSSFDVPRTSEQALKHKRSNSLPNNITPSDSKELQALSQSSNDYGNMALFRFRVLMTSKWLSFGRLLFSPVHNTLGNSPDDRVLIMDGLGNRDWSYYCAVSYPNAQIYSMGPSSTGGNRGSFGGFGHLSNHRHFSYSALGTDFPYPKSFFTAVVFRFPVATSEGILRSTISECKRVLRPGGHLEISTLDLDMTNMGNIGRRAVMNLKLAMQAVDPDVSLKPASDQMQNLLHRRGFENMNRCLVGVPAAGAISSPVEMDLGTLAGDQSREGDESITKQVAQVGRWWYSRCYEAVLGEERGSMWSDGALLRECEELGTTLKLLVCHAQKPERVERRTVSL